MTEEMKLEEIKVEWRRKSDNVFLNWLLDKIWLLRALIFEKPRLSKHIENEKK